MGSAVPSSPIVHLVEDDESSRVAASRVLKSAGYDVRVYASAPEFLEQAFGYGLKRQGLRRWIDDARCAVKQPHSNLCL